MSRERKRTFCRVCEPACGMIAEVEDGVLTGLRPDREHPVTRGFACNKGLATLDIHHDADRVDRPLRRRSDGSFEEISWPEALGAIAARLQAIRERHGAESVGTYVGNPAAFNTLAEPAVRRFVHRLGIRRTFSSGTQDCANKFAGSQAVFGSSTIHPVPDIARTDHLLILGENPKISHMSFLSIADPMAELRAARDRGATIRFVNPRRIESAAGGVGEVVLVRPDSDVYLLAAMLEQIERRGAFDRPELADRTSRLEELRAFAGAWPAERVAPVVRLDAARIRAMADEFLDAPTASVHMSTGVNMGRQGTLAYWLVQMLSLVTGNLDRPGGNVLSVGFYPSAKAGRAKFADGFHERSYGPVRRGPLPGTMMAEEIEDAADPLRAMFVIAGNPLLSVAGEERLAAALGSLDLLVSIDLYRNATGELAHFVLPSTDFLERADLNITGLGLQHRPWVQWSDAVAAPKGERRPEHRILADLLEAMGLEGESEEALWSRMDHMLASRGHSLAELRELPHGIDFGDHEPGDFFERHLQTDDRRVDCFPESFAGAIARMETIFDDLAGQAPEVLQLISKRDGFMHNSWFANVPSMKRADRDRNRLYMHPEDAAGRGLADGATVRIWNEYGAITSELRLSDDLLEGVVAMTHGWGHGGNPGMRLARATAGVNVNRLLPSGPGSYEPLSNQAFMTGVPVRVEAAD